MGIQDRDYYRESSSFLDAWNRQGVTVWLIVITCGVFFGQYFPGGPLLSVGRYVPELVQDGEVWRLFTPMFLHGGIWHLFVNMLVLYFVGSRLEEVYGRGEFVTLYLVSGVCAQLFYFLAWLGGYAPGNPSIGASGAISAILVIYAFNFPHQQVLLYFVIPMPVWLLVVLYIGWDILGAMGARNAPIAYFVHIGGVVFGAVYYLAGIRLSDVFRRSPRAAGERVIPRLRIVPADAVEDTPPPSRAGNTGPSRTRESGEPVEDHLEQRLDLVLAKVSKHGQESLTTEEREILFKASELYKKRRK